MAQIRMEMPSLKHATDAAQPEVSLHVSIPVQIVDISVSGVLLASKLQFAVGDCVELKVELGAYSMSRHLQICRVSPSQTRERTGPWHHAAAIFLPSSSEQQAVLEEILRSE
jgi:PilZ domain